MSENENVSGILCYKHGKAPPLCLCLYNPCSLLYSVHLLVTFGDNCILIVEGKIQVVGYIVIRTTGTRMQAGPHSVA
ncbi:hypothetical protein GDO81_022317 [Engystomops pustulosus]|uniref:Uncharacterized protein n=1 Tax=Engystomops pustulosus TaxID=76066 RepID=A0AAV6ZAW9_ENGPU|nr:hypothetical protein GDO81_022317 [Engystomops pustulosus]